MEVCKNKKELQEVRIVWFGEEAFENGYCTLHDNISPGERKG
jgi:hypothetical protein